MSQTRPRFLPRGRGLLGGLIALGVLLPWSAPSSAQDDDPADCYGLSKDCETCGGEDAGYAPFGVGEKVRLTARLGPADAEEGDGVRVVWAVTERPNGVQDAQLRFDGEPYAPAAPPTGKTVTFQTGRPGQVHGQRPPARPAGRRRFGCGC